MNECKTVSSYNSSGESRVQSVRECCQLGLLVKTFKVKSLLYVKVIKEYKYLNTFIFVFIIVCESVRLCNTLYKSISEDNIIMRGKRCLRHELN